MWTRSKKGMGYLSPSQELEQEKELRKIGKGGSMTNKEVNTSLPEKKNARHLTRIGAE